MKNSGPVNFVIHKIHAKNHPLNIAENLASMGYSHIEISETFIAAGKSIEKLHQELIAGNDFLPTLNENLEDYFKEGNIKIFKEVIVESFSNKPAKILKTLFLYPAPAHHVVDLMIRSKKVAVTRHVFSFRFLYSLSMAVLAIILSYIVIKLINPAIQFKESLVTSPNMIVPALMLLIFLVYIFQLFSRRLHNAGMSSWLAFLLFTPFLSAIPGLSLADQKLTLFLSCIPILGVFIIAMLTPTHRYRL